MDNEDLEKLQGFDDLEPLGGLDEEAVHPEINFCTFNVGDLSLTMPIEAVREIIDVSEILPLPRSPEHIRGLVHIRGDVLPVVDMTRIYKTAYKSGVEKKLIIADCNNEFLAIMSDGMPDLLEENEEGDLLDMVSFFNEYKVQ